MLIQRTRFDAASNIKGVAQLYGLLKCGSTIHIHHVDIDGNFRLKFSTGTANPTASTCSKRAGSVRDAYIEMQSEVPVSYCHVSCAE